MSHDTNPIIVAGASSPMASGRSTSCANCITSPGSRRPCGLGNRRGVISPLQNERNMRLAELRCLHGTLLLPVRGS